MLREAVPDELTDFEGPGTSVYSPLSSAPSLPASGFHRLLAGFLGFCARLAFRAQVFELVIH